MKKSLICFREKRFMLITDNKPLLYTFTLDKAISTLIIVWL